MNENEDEIKLLFLLSGSCNALPTSYVKLRSYLNIYSSRLANKERLKLPKCFTTRSMTCPYCYIPWNSDASIKLLPEKKLKAGQKRRRKKTEDALLDNNQSSDPSRNQLVLKCRVCGQKSSFSLLKRKKIHEKVEEVKAVTKSKKKKKDKSCGLLIDTKTSKELVSQNKANKIKKENREENINKRQSSSVTAPPSKNQSNKNLVMNPYATQIQDKNSRRRKKNLGKLKKLQEDKSVAKKTLKDFLTLVTR